MLRYPNYDDGDRNFSRGKVFTRFDVLSEFDLVYKRNTGFRVSAAGWWDPGYNSLDNTSTQTSNHLVNGRPALGLPDYTSRYAKGGSGEFLDVFVFDKWMIAGVPVNVRLGQTTVFWGESLLFNGAVHSVAYSQNPLDVWKALSTPGAEAKELFRPRVGLNLQAQVSDDWSVAAQYFFNWQRFSNQAWRLPESGSYLSIGDAILWGGESNIANATGTQRVLARHRHHAGRKHRQLGPGGALEPRLARRHAGRVLPQDLRHDAAGDGDAGGASQPAGAALRGPRRHADRRDELATSIRARLRCSS